MLWRCLVVGLCLFGLCAPALAEPTSVTAEEEARKAYGAGSRRFDVGDYGQALLDFKRAYLLSERPALLFNIAACHRMLGHREEAIVYYERYLSKVPEFAERAEVERLVASLRAGDPTGAKSATPSHVEPVEPRPSPTPVVPPESKPVSARLAPELAQSPPRAVTPRPGPRRWHWVILGVGGGLLVAAGVGLAVGLTRDSFSPTLPSFGPPALRQAVVIP